MIDARVRWVVTCLLGVLALPGPAVAQEAVFVVRHAERADGGAASMTATTDPPLSTAGEARAARLAAMLGDAGVTVLFATEFQRTVATVAPLARRLGLTVRQIPARDTAGLVARVRGSRPDDVVVIAGHSNTVPEILKALGAAEPVTIADDEYDALFVVTPRAGAPPTVIRLRY